MSDRPIIEVRGISKLYRLGNPGAGRVRDLVQSAVARWRRKSAVPLAPARQNRSIHPSQRGPEPNTFWALHDVSFEVHPGEVIGIIGRNGAGKSTLLKILSRITEPTSGRAVLRGRVASLLEVGTGFHPDLSGRENIYLNGAILGMKRPEIAARFDEIVEFAEVNAFLDTPVKHYSSGMYVRLAFAVAAHLQPEILIVDEVLAVGDAAFQKKCLGKMNMVARAGRTVLFVSHSMAAIQTLCSRAVLIENGGVASVGPAEAVMARYIQATMSRTTAWRRPPELPKGALCFQSVDLRMSTPRVLVISMGLESAAPHRAAFVAADILNSLGISIMQALPTVTPFISARHRSHQLEITIELPPLVPGRYAVCLWAGPHNTETYDLVEGCVAFEIETSPTEGRTFVHTSDHGSIVPPSTYAYTCAAPLEPASLTELCPK